jgi:hypothetical protein
VLWDILITAAIGSTQLVLTWYGVHMSVTEHRIRHAVFIGILGGVGIGLTIYGAIRSGNAQAALQAQLDVIQKNTEKPIPPPVVNVNPPQAKQRTSMEVQFEGPAENSSNHHLVVNVKCVDTGPSTATDTDCQGQAFLYQGTYSSITSKSEEQYFQQFLRAHKERSSGVVIGLNQWQWLTTDLGPLDEQLVNDLRVGKKIIFVMGRYKFADEAGTYRFDFCEWLQPPANPANPAWHLCSVRNEPAH